MNHKIRFGELRQLLLDIGFAETAGPAEIVFRHEPSDTLFVFRPYRAGDAVAGYNVIEVKEMLEARGLMSSAMFDNQLKKAPA